MQSTYRHDKIVPFENSEASKKEQVASMFDSISRRYDFLNRFLSAGRDINWRKKAIRKLALNNPRIVLDAATGTGDMALMACPVLKPDKIIGIDISEGMLEVGRKKVKEKGLEDKIELIKGDSETINFPPFSFDAVMVAFGVRNFENLEKGLTEINRVLKPGGQLVILEFSKPRFPVIKQLYGLYMGVIAPKFGGVFSKNKKAYRYLHESIRAFPEGKDFLKVLSKTGFQDISCKALSLGICSIYYGRK